jgi:hypothetical protein
MNHGARTSFAIGFAFVAAFAAPFAAVGLFGTLAIGVLAALNLSMADSALIMPFSGMAIFTLVTGTLAGICSSLSRRCARASAARPGFCVGCGYDLRGSTERCPECGQPIRGQS